MAFNQADSLRYYSFIAGSPDERREALLLNQYANSRMKYEFIKNVDVKKIIKVNRIEITIRKAILNVNVRGINIFDAIEQGYGKKSNDMFMYYYPEHAPLVKTQFKEKFMNNIEIENKDMLEISVKIETKEQKEYLNTINKNITIRLKE